MTSGSILAALTPHLSEPSPVIELPGLWTGSTLGAALLSVAGPVLNGSSESLGLWETDLRDQSEMQQTLSEQGADSGVQKARTEEARPARSLICSEACIDGKG